MLELPSDSTLNWSLAPMLDAPPNMNSTPPNAVSEGARKPAGKDGSFAQLFAAISYWNVVLAPEPSPPAM